MVIAGYSIWVLLGYFGIGILGVVAHFFKQKIRGQSANAIKKWFKGHAKDSVLVGISFIVGFAVLVQMGDVSIISSFMSGYICDSLFSKADKDEK